jgi:hypothetical protein
MDPQFMLFLFLQELLDITSRSPIAGEKRRPRKFL